MLLEGHGSHVSLRGKQFAMIISNPAFPPTTDDSRHDVHFGEVALLGMNVLDTIVRELDAHLTSIGQPLIVTAAPGGDPLPSPPPTPGRTDHEQQHTAADQSPTLVLQDVVPPGVPSSRLRSMLRPVETVMCRSWRVRP